MSDGPEVPEVIEDLHPHSPKGWLDTFAIQAGFNERETDMLCHWNSATMQKRYNRNFSGVEVRVRAWVIRFMMSRFRSQPEGRIAHEPPKRETLPFLTTSLDPNDPIRF